MELKKKTVMVAKKLQDLLDVCICEGEDEFVEMIVSAIRDNSYIDDEVDYD